MDIESTAALPHTSASHDLFCTVITDSCNCEQRTTAFILRTENRELRTEN